MRNPSRRAARPAAAHILLALIAPGPRGRISLGRQGDKPMIYVGTSGYSYDPKGCACDWCERAAFDAGEEK